MNYFLLFIYIYLIFSSKGFNSFDMEDYKFFINENVTLHISLPRGTSWTYSEISEVDNGWESRMDFFPPFYKETDLVFYMDLSCFPKNKSMTLVEIAEESYSNFNNPIILSNFPNTPPSKLENAKSEAVFFSVRLFHNMKIQIIKTFFTYNGYTIVITLSSPADYFDELLPEFERILRSVNFSEN